MTLALTSYEWLRIVHVMSTVLWVGGGATLTIYALLTMRQNTPAEQASFARKAGLIGERLYMPLSFVLLGTGIAMVEKLDLGYDPFWILFGLVGWGVSGATGALFLGPESKRLGKLLAERPPEDPEAQSRIRRILVIARLDALLLLAIVFVMIAKF